MKKKILSAILMIALLVNIAGCGKKDSATADASSQVSTEVPVDVESNEEEQDATSSRQEQFEKDKEYLLSKGLTDFGWKDYWNHFIAIEDNDERLEFAATYDRFVSMHLEFKTFYYGLRGKTVEVPDAVKEYIEYVKESGDIDFDNIYEFEDSYYWYTQNETNFEKWAESVILSGLKVHSKYYDEDLVNYERNLSNIDIVNISDEEIINLTNEDIVSIKRMYLDPANSNIVMYYSEVGETMPYNFSEEDYRSFESRYNHFMIDVLAESENAHQLKPWHLAILNTYMCINFDAARLVKKERGVSNDTTYSEEEFIERIEELFEEDLNGYRTLFGKCIGLAPFKLADDWTRSYARQRAYERLWTCYGPAGDCPTFDGYSLDLTHVRPFTDADWNIIDSYDSIRQIWYDAPLSDSKVWQGNTVWSKGRLAAWDHRNWPEEYQDHARAENGSGEVLWLTEEELKYFLPESEIENVDILSKEDFELTEYYAKLVEYSCFWGLYFEFDHCAQFISDDYIHCAVGCNKYEEDYVVHQEFYSLNNEDGRIDTRRAYMFPEVIQAVYDGVIATFGCPDYITTQEEADLFMYRALHGIEDANKESLETSNFVSMEELEKEREEELKALEEKNSELSEASSNSSIYNNPYAIADSDDAKTIDELRAFLKKNGQQTKFFTMYSTWKQLYNDNKNDVSEQDWLNRFGQYLTDDEF